MTVTDSATLPPLPDLDVAPAAARTPVETGGYYGYLLLRRSWLIVLIGLVCAGAGYLVANDRPATYEGTAQVLLGASDPASDVLGTADDRASSDPERDVNTEVALIQTRPIIEQAKQRLGLTTSTTKLMQDVSAKTTGTSRLVDVTADRGRAVEAAALANAVVDAYVASEQQAQRGALSAAAASVRAQLRALPEKGSKQARNELRADLRRVQYAHDVDNPGVRVVAKATPADEHASPQPLLAGVAGGALGLVLGALIVLAGAAVRQARRFR
jgi:uncharacterized protein involved in exopolysaccharide biosynthesis